MYRTTMYATNTHVDFYFMFTISTCTVLTYIRLYHIHVMYELRFIFLHVCIDRIFIVGRLHALISQQIPLPS